MVELKMHRRSLPETLKGRDYVTDQWIDEKALKCILNTVFCGVGM
jgi:hypothetical protein